MWWGWRTTAHTAAAMAARMPSSTPAPGVATSGRIRLAPLKRRSAEGARAGRFAPRCAARRDAGGRLQARGGRPRRPGRGRRRPGADQEDWDEAWRGGRAGRLLSGEMDWGFVGRPGRPGNAHRCGKAGAAPMNRRGYAIWRITEPSSTASPGLCCTDTIVPALDA